MAPGPEAAQLPARAARAGTRWMDGAQGSQLPQGRPAAGLSPNVAALCSK